MLKGNDTGVFDDPTVRFFMMGADEWRQRDEWPPKDARWTPFFFHERQLLSEREHWWDEPHDTFFDTPWQREAVEYWTPKLIDHIEIAGPIGVELYAASTDHKVRWIVSILQEDVLGRRKLLTKGALEGDYHASLIDGTPPYAPLHDFTMRTPIEPGRSYKYSIRIPPTAVRLSPGMRLGVRVSCADDAPMNSLEGAAAGHLRSSTPRRVAIYHDEHRASCVWLPIVSGNVIGTFLSGGEGYIEFEESR